MPSDLAPWHRSANSCQATNVRIHAQPKVASGNKLLGHPHSKVTVVVQVAEKGATKFGGHKRAGSTS